MKEQKKSMARRVYEATIGHPMASGKGRHEEAARLRPNGGSPTALRDGVYGPKAMARDVMDAGRGTLASGAGRAEYARQLAQPKNPLVVNPTPKDPGAPGSNMGLKRRLTGRARR